MTELIEGPIWYFASGVFILGVLYRLFSILRAGIKADLSTPRAGGAAGGLRAIFSRSIPRSEISTRGRITVIASYLFHLGLFALLFFAQPHVDFFADKITGFSWPALPYWGFIISAQLAFIGLLLLWLHRVLHPVTRLLSSLDDHVGAWLVFMVMLTGCLALAQAFEPLRLLHLFLAELLLIYFPFSNLMHAFTFAFSRGYTGATMGRKGVNA